MDNSEKYLSEIKEIRKMMEESSRFLSLSGLSGILVGIYALIGAYLAQGIIKSHVVENTADRLPLLLPLAILVLVLSLMTVVLLTLRRTNNAGKKFSTPGTRLMLVNLFIPLVSGGLLILIFYHREIYQVISPGMLVFYGLALINAAKFTRQEIFWLGIFEISLGILAALLPIFSLYIWALGFGVLHIIYGILMYYRYEHNKESRS